MKYELKEYTAIHKSRLVKKSNNLDELKKIASNLKAYEIVEYQGIEPILGCRWYRQIEYKRFR